MGADGGDAGLGGLKGLTGAARARRFRREPKRACGDRRTRALPQAGRPRDFAGLWRPERAQRLRENDAGPGGVQRPCAGRVKGMARPCGYAAWISGLAADSFGGNSVRRAGKKYREELVQDGQVQLY